MHKLAKGLKKKKKKKDKKGAEEDDFDPEELERYRRERAEAQQKQAEEAAASGEGATAAGSDEWKKFEALTAGVDSILKKTQGDLSRIKSTSYFQRRPVESDIKFEDEALNQLGNKTIQTKKWTNFDKDGNPIAASEEDAFAKPEEKPKTLEDAIVDVPDDDDDVEDAVDQDIFDTTYIDVLQNIDVQLAYIPESPTEEETGDDPFDTTSADKVLKTVDKKGRKVLSIGNAVEVLSGRIEHVSTCKIGRGRKQVSVDLLLDESNEKALPENLPQLAEEGAEAAKTLLDDDADLPDIPVDLTQLPAVIPRPVTPVTVSESNTESAAAKPPIDISEFEILHERTVLDEIPDLGADEFDLGDDAPVTILQEEEDPFAEKAPENPELLDEIVEVNFEAKTNAEGEDPFDTAFAENILPGKTELKLIEKELQDLPAATTVAKSIIHPVGLQLSSQNLDTTQSNLSIKKPDLLGGSNSDLSELVDQPIAPAAEITYVDPFDTSAIQELPPGRVELKFLEKELLGEDKNQVTQSLDDDDFDPRKDEQSTSALSIQTTEGTVEEDFSDNYSGIRKVSRPENLHIGQPKTVEFQLPTPSKRQDLLATCDEEKHLPSKPLTPYYSQKSLEEALPIEEEDEVEVDPFDTDFVRQIAPGKTELKLIESELLSSKDNPATDTQDLTSNSKKIASIVEAANKSATASRKGFASQRQESILDTQVEATVKPLTPNIEPKVIEEEEQLSYVDPFDTSIATNIRPGKAELKLLEKELDQVEEKVRVNPISLLPLKNVGVVEEDFDPRASEPKESQDFLCSDSQDLADKVLTPLQEGDFPVVDADPFDTSFATLAPGKTELKLLESELVTK